LTSEDTQRHQDGYDDASSINQDFICVTLCGRHITLLLVYEFKSKSFLMAVRMVFIEKPIELGHYVRLAPAGE
jgi:hypothetical protein